MASTLTTHSPQFNNCLTLPHLKAFLLLTSLTPPGICFIAHPPLSLIMHDLRVVLDWSYSDPRMRGIWWKRWYSWVVGPFGRWAIGLVWSYRRFEFGGSIGEERGRRPSLFYLGLLACGVVFACVTLVSRFLLALTQERFLAYFTNDYGAIAKRHTTRSRPCS